MYTFQVYFRNQHKNYFGKVGSHTVGPLRTVAHVRLVPLCADLILRSEPSAGWEAFQVMSRHSYQLVPSDYSVRTRPNESGGIKVAVSPARNHRLINSKRVRPCMF